MEIPKVIQQMGKWNIGVYSNVVIIDYNMFYISILVDIHHPQGAILQSLWDARKSALKELEDNATLPDHPDWQIVFEIKKKIITEVNNILNDPEQSKDIINRAEYILKLHIDKLNNYGRVIAYDADTIYFIPDEQYMKELEEKEYFCKDINKPYVAVCDQRAEWMIIYGNGVYVLQKQNTIINRNISDDIAHEHLKKLHQGEMITLDEINLYT